MIDNVDVVIAALFVMALIVVIGGFFLTKSRSGNQRETTRTNIRLFPIPKLHVDTEVTTPSDGMDLKSNTAKHDLKATNETGGHFRAEGNEASNDMIFENKGKKN